MPVRSRLSTGALQDSIGINLLDLHSIVDLKRWQSITEESIYLQDGILRSIDLVENEFDYKNSSNNYDQQRETENNTGSPSSSSAAAAVQLDCELEDVLKIISLNDKQKIPQHILKLCVRNVEKVTKYQRYCWNVLNALWYWKFHKARPKVNVNLVDNNEVDSMYPTLQAIINNATNSQRRKTINNKDNHGLTESDEEELADEESDVENDDEESKIDSSNLSSRLSLLLMVPVLKAQATQDGEIARTTCTLLFDMLSNISPMSLLNEIPEPLDTLEDLLCEWITTKGQDFQPIGPNSLIALTCARGQLSSLLKAYKILQKVKPNTNLQVTKLLKKLEKVKARRGELCSIQRFKRVLVWPFDDQLPQSLCGTTVDNTTASLDSTDTPDFDTFEASLIGNHDRTETRGFFLGRAPVFSSNNSNNSNSSSRRRNNSSNNSTNNSIDILRPTVTTDGKFLYISGSKGKGLAKMGTGLNGTLQGWIYNTNKAFDGGFLAFGNGLLISRPKNLDEITSVDDDTERDFVEILCLETLSTKGIVTIRNDADISPPYITIGLTSDGCYFYLLRVSIPAGTTTNQSEVESEIGQKAASNIVLAVWIDIFQIREEENSSGKNYALIGLRRIPISRNTSSVLPKEREDARNSANSSQRWKFHPYENSYTTLGITLKQLIVSFMFSNGIDLTLVTNSFESESSTASGGTATTSTGTAPQPPGGLTGIGNTLRGMIHGPVSILHPRKAHDSGLQISIDLIGNTCTFKRNEMADFPFISYSHHNMEIIPGSTYDFKHNIIWLVYNDYMYAWRNPGYRPLWYREKKFMITKIDDSIQDGINLTASQVLNFLIKHAGIMASHFLTTRTVKSQLRPVLQINIGFEPTKMPIVLELLKNNLENLSETEFVSLFLILQAMISNITTVKAEISSSIREIMSTLMNLMKNSWFIENFKFNSTIGLHYELAKLCADVFEHLPTKEEKSAILDELSMPVEDNNNAKGKCLKLVQEVILKHFTLKLKDYGILYPEGAEFLPDIKHLKQFVEQAVTFTSNSLEELGKSGIINISNELPVVDVVTHYLQAVTNYILRSWVIVYVAINESAKQELLELTVKYLQAIINSGTLIIQKAIQLFNPKTYCLEVYNFIENTLKSSIIGLVIPQILTFFSAEKVFYGLEKTQSLGNEVVSFYIALTHLSHLMHSSCFSKTTEDQDELTGDDWTSIKKYTTPWNQSRYISSHHPIKENTKMKQTITIPNARKLYVKFDSECATQYEYDKLVLSSGTPGNGQVINEYGGNHFGYGGHVIGNWPSHLIGIDGDTLNYAFENRSARENLTPDHACWGFGFTVFPKFLSDLHPSGLKSLKDTTSESEEQVEVGKHNRNTGILQDIGLITSVTLATIEVMLRITSQLLRGKPLTKEELLSCKLLSDPMFSKYRWVANPQLFSETADVSQFLLTKEQIQYLRKVSGNIAKPQMSTRMKNIIQPDKLEPIIITGVLRCLTNIPINQFNESDSDATILLIKSGDTLSKLFQCFNAIVRNMMSYLELQWRFENEVEEIIQKTKTLEELFFNDTLFTESTTNIESLAFICDVEFDGSEEMKITALENFKTIANAFCLEGIKPNLHRAEDAINEIYQKCLFLATGGKQQVESIFKNNVILQWSNEITSFKINLALITSFLTSQVSFEYTKNMTLEKYFEIMELRTQRAEQRVIALEHWIKILQMSVPNSTTLECASGVMNNLCIQEKSITCGNMDSRIPNLFGQVISSIVHISEKQPLLYRFAIALLCLLDYKRQDEPFLIRSGLLSLVDRLCAFQITIPSGESTDLENTNLHNRASSLGWAAFQILASTCSSWRTPLVENWNDTNHIALPIQISLNVANHLARASKLSKSNQINSTLLSDSIQDVLILLDSLRNTKLGFEILKQSPCICRLLSLFQDPMLLSPRLVLIIIRLLHTALPSIEDLNLNDLPQNNIPGLKKRLIPGNSSSQSTNSNNTSQYIVASLLLSKLADFLINNGNQSNTSSLMNNSSPDAKNGSSSNNVTSAAGDKKNNSVWILRRETTRLRVLFEPEQINFRPQNITLTAMESKLERDGKVLVFLDENLESAKQKAQRLARMGFVVLLDKTDSIFRDDETIEPIKGMSEELICKQKNSKLATTESSKQFLSGEVAENLAKSIIGLLRSLLTPQNKIQSTENLSPTSSNTSTIYTPDEMKEEHEQVAVPNNSHPGSLWRKAVEDSIIFALRPLKKICSIQYPIFHEAYGSNAKLAIAALALLGSFPETIREGSIVCIDDQFNNNNNEEHEETANNSFGIWSSIPMLAKVLTVNNATCTATIEIIPNQKNNADKYIPSRIFKVPISRLIPKNEQNWVQIPELSIEAQKQIALCLRSLFLSQTTTTTILKDDINNSTICPLKKPLPSLNQILIAVNTTNSTATPTTTTNNDSSSSRMVYCATALVRLIAEIKARASHVLSLWLKKKRSFLLVFLGTTSNSNDNNNDIKISEEGQIILKNLKLLAKESKPSYRLESIENQVSELRILQRDFTKPQQKPLLTSATLTSQNNTTHWDFKRQFPPIRRCIFSNNFTTVKFCGDSSLTTTELPRGLLLIGNNKLSSSGGEYYFEIQIQSLGEPTNNDLPGFSIGFIKNIQNSITPNTVWQLPSGSIFLQSNGQITYYVGIHNGTWRNERFDKVIKVGDIIGIGWEKIDSATEPPAVELSERSRPRQIATPRPAIPLRRGRAASFGNVTFRNTNAEVTKGRVIFTINGTLQKVMSMDNNDASNYWPSLHFQKTNTEILTNFGKQPFAYAGGQKLMEAANNSVPRDSGPHALSDSDHELFVRFTESFDEVSEHFGQLVQTYPFPDFDPSDSEMSFQEAETVDAEADLDADAENTTEAGSESESHELSLAPSHNSFDDAETTDFVPLFNLDAAEEAQEALDEDQELSEAVSPDSELVEPIPLQNRFQILPLTVEHTESAQELFSNLATPKDNSKFREPVSDNSSDYSYTAGSEYYLSPSPSHDLRVFSGPNRYVCQCINTNDCSKNEDTSLLNDDEDINQLLIKAWETRVFPIIRRRFRNESERREGLEQIRGALIIGMPDIARQTVEFLYEEGSGMPRDLHFPTIEEVQDEYNKFTIKKVHIGMRVTIKALNSSNDTESMLPKFATPQMLRCFGLTGEVLDISNEHDLVLVEAYALTEGLLSRFWYPLKYLERAKQKPSNSKSMNVFKLHSNLVLLETCLSQLYCREAFLTILNASGEIQVNKPTSSLVPLLTPNNDSKAKLGLITHLIPSLQLEFENLQLKSLSCFRKMPLNGDLLTWNLEFATPAISDLTDINNPINLFYSDCKDLLKRISCSVEMSAKLGSDTLIKQIDNIYQLGTDGFIDSELQLDKEGVSSEVYLPGVAFSILCFRRLTSRTNFNVQNGKPCVHISGFNGSEYKKYPLACFPLRLLNSFHGNSEIINVNVFRSRESKNLLPTIMVPCEKFVCTITGNTLKDNALKVQGIPAHFPLLLAYYQSLLLFTYKHPGLITDQVIVHLVHGLCNFVQKTSLTPLVKEWIFTIISDALNQIQDEAILKEFYEAQINFVKDLFTELLILYNKETKSTILSILRNTDITSQQQQQRNATGPGIVEGGAGNNTTEHNNTAAQLLSSKLNISRRASFPLVIQNNLRSIPIGTTSSSKSATESHEKLPQFSSYFQSVLELCISLSQIKDLLSCPSSTISSSKTSPVITPEKKQSPTNITTTSNEIPSSSSSVVQRSRIRRSSNQQISINTSNNPKKVTAAAANNVKSGRNRTLETLARKQMNTSSVDKDSKKSSNKPNAPDAIAALIKDDPAFLKRDIFSWFHNILLSYVLLKTFTWNQLKSDFVEFVEQLLPDTVTSLYDKTNHTRLFIICGVPDNIHGMSIESSINRGLSTIGGIYGNEVWISKETNDAVIEIRSATKRDEAFEILNKNITWYPIEDYILYPEVNVYQVNENLEIGEKRPDQVFSSYLRSKIFENDDQLCVKGEDALSYIYTSCYAANEKSKHVTAENKEDGNIILLNASHLLNKANENLMLKFIENVKPKTYKIEAYILEVLKGFGQKRNIPTNCQIFQDINGKDEYNFDARPNSSAKTKAQHSADNDELLEENDTKLRPSPRLLLENKSSSLWLSNDGFIRWCTALGKENIYALWKGLLNTGYDVRLDRTWSSDSSYLTSLMINGEWTQEQDAAIVAYIDNLTQALRIPPNQIHPHEIYFEDLQFLNPVYHSLKEIPIEFIRARCCILQILNTNVLTNLLPYFSLHNGTFNKSSVGNLLHDSRHLLFFHTKDEFFSEMLLHSAVRGNDINPPEVILDPVQSIGKTIEKSFNTSFCKAFTQLSEFPSQIFAVPPSSGSDPPLPIVVKVTGEEVLGTIGSFRQFLTTVVDELKGPALNIIIPCPSSDAGKNKDSLILRPGPLSYGEEKILQNFGKFIGICLRADVPILLQLLPATLRSLLNSPKEINDETDDLVEVDVLTASLLRSFQMIESPELFTSLLADNDTPNFEWTSMSRDRDSSSGMVPLCPGGSHLAVSWETKDQFINLLRKLRIKELTSSNRVQMILAGLATVIPLSVVFNLFTSSHLDWRFSGSPNINLALLKAHTHYQVGISETDQHILYFWAVLESMTPEELKNFIKFATNQERLPISCPCQNIINTTKDGPVNRSSNQIIHVPPFPMKIAPITLPTNATIDYINKQTIRAETCLFLLRLPPYSSYQVTREQLLFACNAKDDPLSG